MEALKIFNWLNPLEPLFNAIAERIDFPVDQVRYIILLFLSFPLAYILRHTLHPSRTSLTVRYVYSLSLGLYFGFSCFGVQMAILFGIVGVSYLMLLLVPPTLVQRFTMVWAMGSLCAAHYYRLVTDYGGWHLDFTGPLMVIVQKLTMVAYALHDGKGRKVSSLNEDQKLQKITTPPTILEYFCYVFNFHSLLAGPSCTIHEFQSFMDGSNLKPMENPNAFANAKEHSKEPSSLYPVVTKFLYSIISLWLFLFLCTKVSHEDVLNPEIPFLLRVFYVHLDGLRIRTRYYFIWILVDSISNLAGLGFNGYDKLGNSKWDLVTNVHAMEVEWALNIREIATRWNALTSNWMRRCVYERSPVAPTLVTYALSAVWHGFYPGYYFTFIFFGIETEAARKIRRLVRPYFQSSLPLKWGYHVATWTATRLLLDFGALPFEFMWIEAGLRFWGYYYYVPVIAVCVVAFLFPSGRSSRKEPKTTSAVTANSHNSSTSTNNVPDSNKKTE